MQLSTSYPDLYVGDYVPFYFCPRSIMLFIIHQANHPELDYRGGQVPIVHLQADLHTSVACYSALPHHSRKRPTRFGQMGAECRTVEIAGLFLPS